MNDRTSIKLARDNIAGCDPALEAVTLKRLDDGIGHSHVLRRVADEDGGRTTACLLVTAAFGHFGCPRHLCRIVADALLISNYRGFLGRGTSASERSIRLSKGQLLTGQRPIR